MTAKAISSMTAAGSRLNLASAALVLSTGLLLFHFGLENKTSKGQNSTPSGSAAIGDAGDRLAQSQDTRPPVAGIPNIQPHFSTSKPRAGTAARSVANAPAADNLTQLLVRARLAEKQVDAPAALNFYRAVLRLQPENQEARNGLARLEVPAGADPVAANNDLKSAIRSFYQGQFDDARSGLMGYLESPQTARNPGAADFYLGATLIERSFFRTPQAQWRGPSHDALVAFKQARNANYKPVRAYVSPMLLKVWDSTAQ